MDITPEFVDYFIMAIALITDFGESDYFVGAMKGAMLSINPDVFLVDITHSIPRHEITAAAFCLGACYKDFPVGTVFLCVVDPGVGSSRRAIAADSNGRLFVAPDNGVLTQILKDNPAALVVELENPQYRASNISNTFHGRDIFAPAAAHLSKGVEISELGAPAGNPVLLTFDQCENIGDGVIKGSVIHIDVFGNLVTNIPSSNFDQVSAIEIAGRKIFNNVEYYEETAASDLFFINGSAGFIEICRYRKSAAKRLHSRVSDPLHAHLKTSGPQ